MRRALWWCAVVALTIATIIVLADELDEPDLEHPSPTVTLDPIRPPR